MLTADSRPNGASDEATLRQWGREHYVPLPERSLSWPGYVLDEMRLMDEEMLMGRKHPTTSGGCEMHIHGAHAPFRVPKLLLRVATIPNATLNDGSGEGSAERHGREGGQSPYQVPIGTIDNSPPFQGWVGVKGTCKVPAGTTEHIERESP